MSDPGSALEGLRFAAGGGVVGVGAGVVWLGALGHLRFPDFFARVHAVALTETVGATMVLIGLALAAPSVEIAARMAAIWLALTVCSPASLQGLTGAAHAGGIDPIVGRYTAPKPGAAHGGGTRR